MDSGVWPRGAREEPDGEISVAGVRLSALATAYGTPALIFDESDVRYRCRSYVAALPGTEIAYAGKAFLCRALAQWIAAEELSLTVSSAGELAVAQAVNFPAERIILQGNATPADLRAALRYGVDRMVVDSTAEIVRLAALTPRLQRVFVQVTPDVHAPADRPAVTGADDQRPGFSLRSGAAADAVRRVLSHPELTLTGLRCQLAAQPTELSDYETAAREILGLMAAVRDHTRVTLTELNLGGGYAVPYLAGDDDVGLATFAERVRRVISSQCAELRLPVPRLVIEPGRAIVNHAMITLCRVLAVKRSAAGRMFVTLDGSLTENPGQEPYGLGYSVHAVRPSNAPSEPATVAGRHGEAGDVIAADVALPADVRPGDLVALPGTGAYNHSMAPGYTVPRTLSDTGYRFSGWPRTVLGRLVARRGPVRPAGLGAGWLPGVSWGGGFPRALFSRGRSGGSSHGPVLWPGLCHTCLSSRPHAFRVHHHDSTIASYCVREITVRRTVPTLVGRPPVIAVKNGEPRALIRKETISDLLVRDIGL